MQGSTTTLGGNGSSSLAARDTASQMSEKAHAGVDRLTKTAHSTIDRVTDAASSAAERLSEGRLAHSAEEFRHSTVEYVRGHPLTALGIAVAAGFVLSRLISLR